LIGRVKRVWCADPAESLQEGAVFRSSAPQAGDASAAEDDRTWCVVVLMWCSIPCATAASCCLRATTGPRAAGRQV